MKHPYIGICLAVVLLIAVQTAMTQVQNDPTIPPASARQSAEDQRARNDWPNLARYRAENQSLATPAPDEDRVVFMGDSITEGWKSIMPDFFATQPYLDRGIRGQTSPQMLIRFRPDVIDLKPKVVVILAGTNDVAANTGPMTPKMTEDNIASMVDLAKANKIKVVLSSILPAYDFPWRPGLEPAPKIAALNDWIKSYAAANDCVYLDYYSAMVDDRKGLKAELTPDGVHPNQAGYQIMAPLAIAAIHQALNGK